MAVNLRQLTDLLNYLIPQNPRLETFVVKTWNKKEQHRLERWCEIQVDKLLMPDYKAVGKPITLTRRMLTIQADEPGATDPDSFHLQTV